MRTPHRVKQLARLRMPYQPPAPVHQVTEIIGDEFRTACGMRRGHHLDRPMRYRSWPETDEPVSCEKCLRATA